MLTKQRKLDYCSQNFDPRQMLEKREKFRTIPYFLSSLHLRIFVVCFIVITKEHNKLLFIYADLAVLLTIFSRCIRLSFLILRRINSRSYAINQFLVNAPLKLVLGCAHMFFQRFVKVFW